MKICTTCGKEWPDEFRLCPADGSSLRADQAAGDLVDTVLAHRYHISKKLGQGGMGAVYLGEHVKMGQLAAIKVINRSLATDPAAIARFTREARNAARIRHPNVCMIHDFGETEDGLIYMVMEYIEGESLADLLHNEGALSLPRAADIMSQCCDALQAAHDLDIVHRDIKPENIMIAKGRDGSDVVKVVDFGIAKAVAGSESGQTVTQTGFIVGTPDYMSPDQVSGVVLDGRSDIYSLAVVFFRMVTGTLPFQAETPQDALLARLASKPMSLQDALPAAGFSPELQRVLDRALEQRREQRYSTAIEFGTAVLQAVRGGPAEIPTTVSAAETRPLQTPEPLRRPATGGASPPIPGTVATPETPQPSPSPVAAKKKGPRLALAAVGAVVLVGGAAVVWQVTSGGSTADPVPDSTVVAEGDSTKDDSEAKDEETLGTINISGFPNGGTILFEGEELEAPFQLPEGRHEIELRAPGFENKTLEIEVIAGERMTVMYAARPVQTARARTRPAPPPPAARRATGRTIRVGQTVNGTISDSDRLYEDRHVQSWSLQATAGQRVDITLRSTDFDAFLYLTGPGLTEPLENDDGAGSLNSRISTTLQAGTYTILASTLAQGATGAYTLGVTAPVSLASLPTGGRLLTMGQTVTGSLTGNDPTYEGRHVQAWELRAAAGTRVDITLRSEDYDAYLYLLGPGLSEPATDDDGGGGRNARIRTTLQGGAYRVIASQYTAGATGAYSLSVARPGTETFPTNGRTIAVGQTRTGTLTGNDQSFSGRQVQAWALRVAPGTRVEITLGSDAIDPYMYLAGPGIDDALSNDDGGDGNGSRIATTLSQGGTYYVLAGAYSSGTSGPYTLTVATPAGLEQLRATGRVLTSGTSASGTLSATDPIFEGRHVQIWQLRVQSSVRITVSMRSSEFDTYLFLSGPGLAEPLTDDDGGEGTNSQITATLRAGTYLVGAAGFGESSVGTYRIGVGVTRQ